MTKRTGLTGSGMMLLLALCMLRGLPGAAAFAGEAETAVMAQTAAMADDPYRLVDIHCSQSAKDFLGNEQLKTLVDLIVTSIEPQAANLLIERFPCFKEAAENDGLGREIGLYIYFGEGDQDGIDEHENVYPDVYAYVLGNAEYEADRSVYQYLICVDAESVSTIDDTNHAVLDLDGPTRIQLDTTFCHELFHAFMDDYNRVGMSGYTDHESFIFYPEEEMSAEEGDELVREIMFPDWFSEGLAGCVGHIYPADLNLFREYHYDPDTRQYNDICTGDQLVRMYVNMGYLEGTGSERYDLEAASEDDPDILKNGAVYVSGYMACLYLADLAYREREGSGAVTFGQNGEMESISSEKLREGLSAILTQLHQGDTLDEVISRISGGAYENTEDFAKRFIKGTYHEETREYDGDPASLSFCVGYLNYMNRLDAMDLETHPAGSLLMDDFASTQPTPLEKGKVVTSDFYRIVEENTVVTSTVPSENAKDGGTSYSGRDSFETVIERFMAKEAH